MSNEKNTGIIVPMHKSGENTSNQNKLEVEKVRRKVY